VTPSSHPCLVLTGTVYPEGTVGDAGETATVEFRHPSEASTGSEATVGGVDVALVEVPFLAGDVEVVSRLDTSGRHNLAGRHTNFGYSGYFKARVFDGKRWRTFKIWDFVPEDARRFPRQGDKAHKMQEVIDAIRANGGKRVSWGNRTYEIAARQ
jgi:hypothetical protein